MSDFKPVPLKFEDELSGIDIANLEKIASLFGISPSALHRPQHTYVFASSSGMRQFWKSAVMDKINHAESTERTIEPVTSCPRCGADSSYLRPDEEDYKYCLACFETVYVGRRDVLDRFHTPMHSRLSLK